MNFRILLVIFVFGVSTPVISQVKYDVGEWYRDSKRNDFGDIEDYTYGYVSYDKFNAGLLVVRVEKAGLGINRTDYDGEIIKFNEFSAPFSIKYKDKYNNVQNEITDMISRNGSVVLSSSSYLYERLTNRKGEKFSVVIYDSTGERMNSFDVTSFEPIFK